MMNTWQSIAFFGLPGCATLIAVYHLVPLANKLGIPLAISWSMALWLPLIVLLAWVLHREARHRNLRSARPMGWFRKPATRPLLLATAVIFCVQPLEIILASSSAWLFDANALPVPKVLPEIFNPTLDLASGLETFLGMPVRGNWWLVLFWLGWLMINIGVEEVLWRGYALPRQERVFGRYAWLVNGLCWNLLFHAFMWWNYIVLLPVSLAVPYLVQRYRNVWIGIYIHGFGNALILAILIPSIGGWL